jgi:hypothetical protein
VRGEAATPDRRQAVVLPSLSERVGGDGGNRQLIYATLAAGPQVAGFRAGFSVEAMGLEPTNLLTASQALYQLSYAPDGDHRLSAALAGAPRHARLGSNVEVI